jgi:hypothetical protein
MHEILPGTGWWGYGKTKRLGVRKTPGSKKLIQDGARP